jgi:hypothetical protein
MLCQPRNRLRRRAAYASMSFMTIHSGGRSPLDDFGGIGCSWRETDVESADRETLIRDLVQGQYSKPVRIVAFNTAEGWSRDVTKDIANELRRRHVEFGEVPDSILNFMDANRR